MPYRYREDLPHSVQNSLPRPAQDIYIEVFNSAWDDYARPQDRRGNDSREEVAHKVAWSAVIENYEKRDGDWVRKPRHNS